MGEQEERSLELAQSWLGDTGRWLKATCSRSQGLQCVTLTFCHDAALQTLRSYSILTCEPVVCTCMPPGRQPVSGSDTGVRCINDA